ncbi:hypothetical protein PLICRDRAFT_413525 [Plicaturopsis crispa FD-325 SS-3]|nr:hypothetical protein PLICRDRAFT_413525 [Plicaturopsis crispa FD-325 SS-3]
MSLDNLRLPIVTALHGGCGLALARIYAQAPIQIDARNRNRFACRPGTIFFAQHVGIETVFQFWPWVGNSRR